MVGNIHAVASAIEIGLFLTFVKLAYESVNVYFCGMAIFFLMFIFFFIVLLLTNRLRECLLVGKRQIYLHVVGFLAGILSLSQFGAMETTSVVKVGILVRTDLLFSILMGVILFGEKFSVTEGITVFSMIIGIVLVMGVSPVYFESVSHGDLLVLLSALILAINAYLIKRKLQGIAIIVIAFYNSGWQGAWFMIMTTAEVIRGKSVIFFGWGWVIIILCIFIHLLFYFSYYQAIRLLPVWQVRAFALVTPVFMTITGVFMANETISFQQSIGIGLVSLGILYLSFIQWRQSLNRAIQR